MLVKRYPDARQLNIPTSQTNLCYSCRSDFLEVMGLLEGVSHNVQLPVRTGHVTSVDAGAWLVQEADTLRLVVDR